MTGAYQFYGWSFGTSWTTGEVWSPPDPDRLHEFDVELALPEELLLVRHRPTGGVVELTLAEWRPLVRLTPLGQPIVHAREAIQVAARRLVREDRERRAERARRRAATRITLRIDYLPLLGPDVELVERVAG